MNWPWQLIVACVLAYLALVCIGAVVFGKGIKVANGKETDVCCPYDEGPSGDELVQAELELQDLHSEGQLDVPDSWGRTYGRHSDHEG